MANLKGNINLARLTNVGCATIKGVPCVVVPIKENDIFVSKDETGAYKHISLSVNIWENKEGADQWGNTHYVQQNYSKEFREANPDRKTYLGNMKPIVFNQQQADVSSLPPMDTDGDDLPF